MAALDLYWLPLGAGGHFVRLSGRLYEALAARLERRTPRDLYPVGHDRGSGPLPGPLESTAGEHRPGRRATSRLPEMANLQTKSLMGRGGFEPPSDGL